MSSEIFQFLLALAETPAIEITKNKKGKKRRNKVYKYKIGKTVYTLSTGNRGDFKSFYSNKKVNKRRKFAQRGASATGMLTDHSISLIPENSSDGTENDGELRTGTDLNGGNGIRYSVDEQGKMEENGKVFYQIPFSNSVDAVLNHTYSGNGSVFMRDTPQIFIDMGFSKLPIMTTAKHIESIYLPKKTEKDHNHDLGELIKQIPEKLENPLMVITSETHPDTSVVVILELTDKNGDAVVVPILLNGRSEQNKIDAHIMTSAQGRANAFSKLAKNAVEKEKNGIPSVLYAQKKAESILNAEGVQFPNRYAFDSVMRNIADVGLKVKPQTETLQFKKWFGKSKVVDENGDPMVVYHGTNWDMFSEPSGEAVFSDKYRGSGSGDNGFFGRGFYFTFGNGKASEGEAGYYGKNVYPFYLSIKNPFYFSESLYYWNGKPVLGDEVNSVEIVNAVKLFPELLKDFTLSTYDKNGDFAGEITLDKYARMFIDVYHNKKFSIRKSSNSDEIVIEADPVKHEENGHTWIEYGFSERIYNPGSNTDLQLLATHLYFQDRGFSRRDLTVEIPYRLLRDFYGEHEFRSWLERNGYDGVMQSKNGDEVVAFYPNQIKSATDNVGTFDPENPDIRYSIEEYSEEDHRDIVAILQPFVGQVVDLKESEYRKYLQI
ncbi:MAG: hypothetical protein IJW23_06255 [Lentisphaeria bacterium]|nr:hypothetical protein [Lentisphaeria bacterium]